MIVMHARSGQHHLISLKVHEANVAIFGCFPTSESLKKMK